MRIIGIDAATQPETQELAFGILFNDVLVLDQVVAKHKDPFAIISSWIDSGPGQVVLAVDSPLGWPTSLSVALPDHRAGYMVRSTTIGSKVIAQ